MYTKLKLQIILQLSLEALNESHNSSGSLVNQRDQEASQSLRSSFAI